MNSLVNHLCYSIFNFSEGLIMTDKNESETGKSRYNHNLKKIVKIVPIFHVPLDFPLLFCVVKAGTVTGKVGVWTKQF